MFVFKAGVYLNELQHHRPDIYQAAQQAWQHSTHDLDFCRLNENDFAACPSESIDYAVMEHTQAAAMVTVNIGWNDIGSWSSLAEVSPHDAQGNAIRGDVYLAETGNSYIRAESRMVAAIGVRDLVIVETADAVLVMHKDFAQDVKHTVEYLKQAERTEHLVHRRVYRPWGYYEGIDVGDRFQAKRIMVKPGSKLSLQMHHHRAEHWVVVSGTAKVTRGDENILLHEDQSTYIPIGVKTSPGKCWQVAALPDRGAIRRLFGGRRYRALRRRLQAQLISKVYPCAGEGMFISAHIPATIAPARA